MRGKILTLVAAGFVLAGLANAAVTWTWNFGLTAGTTAAGAPNVNNGVYTAGSTSGLTGSFGTGSTHNITVYAEQETITPGGGNTNENTSTGTMSAANTSTLNGLFQVDNVPNSGFGVGIAPYDPSQGGVGGTFAQNLANNQANAFNAQPGISDDTGSVGGNLQNLLLINLGTVNPNETLTFLLNEGNTPESFNVWTSYGSAPTVLGVGGMTEYASNVAVGGMEPTTPQVSYNTSTNGGQDLWVAIQADCHYLLLDQITASYTPATAPEPRFYGMLLAGLLAVAVTLRRRFVTA